MEQKRMGDKPLLAPSGVLLLMGAMAGCATTPIETAGPFVGSLVGDCDSYNVNIVNLNLIYKF